VRYARKISKEDLE
jgi:hypothetical protein